MILQNGKRIDGCSDTVPVGTLQPYLGLVPPKGYLVCQGQLVSKITYKELYEICGDTFGTATPTHFYLPDLRGKTLAGYDENDATMNTIGKLLGQKTHTHTTGNHTLTVAEMPKHEHSVYADAWAGKLAVKMTQREQTSDDGDTYDVADFGHDTSSMSGPLYATEAGGSQAHNHGKTGSSTNYQPTITVNWIVKAVMLIPNYIIVENRLDSDSTVDALSAAQGKYLNDKFADYVTHSELEEFAPSQGGVMEGDVTITGRLHVGTNNANTTDTWIPVIGTNGVYEHTQREFASSVRSTHFGTNGDYLPTLDFLSFWNGAYDDNGKSNLTYCKHGAFGTMATKDSNNYYPAAGGTLYGWSSVVYDNPNDPTWDYGKSNLEIRTNNGSTPSICLHKAGHCHAVLTCDATGEMKIGSLGSNAQTVLTAGNKYYHTPNVFVQSGQPSAYRTGDIWFVV
jgi:microcystin-dependent protein